MTAEPTADGAPSQAEELYFDFRVGSDSGQAPDFETFCRAHPAHSEELRRLHERDQAHHRLVRLGTAPADAAEDRAALGTMIAELRSRGAVTSRYRIGTELGRGGMGVVYEAEDTLLERTVALKVISSSGGAGELLPMFRREMRLAARLNHPGVAGVHDAGVDQSGRVFFAMPLVSGRDLSEVFELVRRGEPGWTRTRALGLLRQVCETMAYVHERGIIHRDLKPSNIRVGGFGQVFVMDWGLAKELARGDEASSVGAPTLPIAGSVSEGTKGTPVYMSPEQARGDVGAIGPPTDIYAIGAMMYELLAGHAPHREQGEEPDNEREMKRVRAGAPLPLERVAPDAPLELISIVSKAMAVHARGRYSDARSMALDLEAYLDGRAPRSFPIGAWGQASKWVKRNKSLALASAAALLAVVVGGVAFGIKARQLAVQNAALDTARGEAEQKANDVLSLSTQKDLDALVARAAELWPAHPEMIPRYEEWLRASHELIDGRPADQARGLKRRMSLEEHKAKLAELRSTATPLTEEQATAERESHPRFAELQAKRAELTWRSRMLGIEPWPSEAEAQAQLAKEELPQTADGINELAWPLVDPDETIHGHEVRALLLARRAIEAATEQERGGIRDTLGWALFRLGRFDDALNEERTALAESGGEALQDSATRLEAAVSSWHGDELAKRREERQVLAAEVAELEGEVRERRTYEYVDPESGWWDAALSKLIADLDALRDPRTGLAGDTLAEPFGWGVAKRYEFAKSIDERSVSGAEAKALWSAAVAAISSSPKYGSLTLTAQLGLLPIGMDPDSGLWEFAHVQTGAPAVRGADGKLVIGEETGLVLVLIPGGRFWMGAQKTDPKGQNYDPQARGEESPVHEVELSPYFLSKYEMTQGQWRRMAARNPSYYHDGFEIDGYAHDLTHPVEQVAWTDCMELMERLQLSLPSEAQWEFGCRGGTQTPWWTGPIRETLRGHANIADHSAGKAGAPWTDIKDWPDLEDGWVFHCPIGRLRANPFGLHEVHGNVWELCLDGYHDYSAAFERDPVFPWSDAPRRIVRGGAFSYTAADARSSARAGCTPRLVNGNTGLRPARRLTP